MNPRLLILKLILLTAAAFALFSADFMSFELSQPLRTTAGLVLLAAFLVAAVTAYLLQNLRGRGWRLGIALFLAFYSLNTVLVAVEAYYLSDVLPLPLALRLLVNGAIAAGLFTLASLWIFGRLQEGTETGIPPFWLGMSWFRWVIGLLLCAFCWVVLFIIVGSLVFRPLALALAPVEAPVYFASFDALAETQGPQILVFQAVRGAIWALLTLPLLRLLKGDWRKVGVQLGLAFAVWMGVNLLYPSGLSVRIQTAHFVEVALENFLYGLLLAWFFAPRAEKVV
ncbi:MAG: hypothetical protein HPY59_02645 [Anaerolineae bacterium]|nr:hypothetical protein [Anaerolineae bacterium]